MKPQESENRAETIKRISALIQRIKQDGYFVRKGLVARRQGQVSVDLPEVGIPFDWSVAKLDDSAIGRWVRVRRRDGSLVWAEITSVYCNQSRRIYRIHTALGRFTRSMFPEPDEQAPYSQKELETMQEIARQFLIHGDLLRAISDIYANRLSDRDQIAKYYRYSKSPTFIDMVINKLSKALDEHGINEDYLVAKRVHLMDTAISEGDFKTAEKTLTVLEQFLSAVRKEQASRLPQVGEIGQTMNMAELAARKQALNAPASDDAMILDEHESSDEPDVEPGPGVPGGDDDPELQPVSGGTEPAGGR